MNMSTENEEETAEKTVEDLIAAFDRYEQSVADSLQQLKEDLIEALTGTDLEEEDDELQ